MSKSAKNAGVAGVVAQLARGDGWRLPWCERRSLVDESVKVEEGERRREREKNRKKENSLGRCCDTSCHAFLEKVISLL